MRTEKGELLSYIITMTVEFIGANFPATQNIIKVSGEFASDIIETRPDWKLPDIKLFFKFIKRNQGLMEEMKSYGNVVTPRKFYEMANKYEEQRSIEREYLLEEKFKQPESKVEANSDKYIALIKEILADLKRKQEYVPDSSLRISHEAHEASLVESVNKGEVKRTELVELLDALEKYYSVEGEKKVYHYNKAIEAIKNKLK